MYTSKNKLSWAIIHTFIKACEEEEEDEDEWWLWS